MKLYKYTYRKTYTEEWVQSRLILLEFEVIKETECGYWIVDSKVGGHFAPSYLLKPKWVSKDGKNVFARACKERALTDFIKRKTKQVGFISQHLRIIEHALKLAKDEKNKEAV